MYPGELSELDFVESYARSALRKPEMAADAALRTLVFSEAGDRAILTGLIGFELAEAARRLVAVYNALADRTYTVARSLLLPLPGIDEWRVFVHRAATFTPEQTLRDLGLGEAALRHAQDLRAQPSLADLDGLISAAATGNPMLLAPGIGRRNIIEECWFSGVDSAGQPFAVRFGASETDAANLADLTGDLCRIGRGLLLNYLEGRRGAGWQAAP
jgi:hypothetical protein